MKVSSYTDKDWEQGQAISHEGLNPVTLSAGHPTDSQMTTTTNWGPGIPTHETDGQLSHNSTFPEWQTLLVVL